MFNTWCHSYNVILNTVYMYLNDPERRMENLICTEGFERALVLKAPWGVLAFVMLTVFPGLSMKNAIPLVDSSEIENFCPDLNFDWIKNDSMPAEPYFSYLWYCWWFRNPKQPPGMVQKPLVSNGIKLPTNWWTPDFFHQRQDLIPLT